MPFAVEFFFDPKTEAIVRRIRDAVNETTDTTEIIAGDYRPHVSLGGCQHLDAEGLAPDLSKYARSMYSFPLTMESFGIFPTEEGVIFLGVTVTRELLATHAEFQSIFERYAEQSNHHYRAGVWVPHCTIAYGLQAHQLAAAVTACCSFSLPIQAEVTEIGVIEVSPVSHRNLFSYNLSTSGNN